MHEFFKMNQCLEKKTPINLESTAPSQNQFHIFPVYLDLSIIMSKPERIILVNGVLKDQLPHFSKVLIQLKLV